MSFRFRKSRSLMPGVRLNVGKRGASISMGLKGLKKTIGTSGSRTTVGLPGTGVSYTKVDGKSVAGSWIGNVLAALFLFGLLVWIFG